MLPSNLYTVDIAVTSVDFIALISIIGSLIARFFVFPKAAFTMPAVLKVWKVFFFINLCLITLTTIGIFIVRSLMFNNGAFDNLYDLLSTVLIQMNFGNILLARMLTILLLWIGFFLTLKSERRFNVAYFFLFLLALTIALTSSSISHAVDNGYFTLKIVIDLLHIVSAGGWGGSVITVVVCFFPFYSALIKQPFILIELLHRLSLVSAIFMILIILSGIYNASWLLGTFSEFAASPAGKILAIKLVFVALMVLLGGVNLLYLIPQISRAAKENTSTDAASQIRDSLIIDAFLVIIILILATILIHQAPPL